MKTLVICLVLLSIVPLGNAQFTYFNQVYPPAQTGAGTLQGKLFLVEDSLFMSVGVEATFSGDAVLSRKVHPSGAEGWLHETYGQGGFETLEPTINTLKLTNGNYIVQTAKSTCNMYFPYFICMHENMDTIWTRQFPQWVNCQDHDSFAPYACIELADGNILSVDQSKYMDENNFDDSLGLRLLKIDANGNPLSMFTITYENIGFNALFGVQGAAQYGGYLLMWGQIAPTGAQDYQLFVIKTTMTGELIDSYIWGNPNNCTEGPCAGYLRDDGKLIITYTPCIEPGVNLINHLNVGVFNPETMLFDTDITQPVADIQDYVSGAGVGAITHSQHGGNISTFGIRFYSEDEVLITCYLLKTTDTGELEWYQGYNSGVTPLSSNRLIDVMNTPDGGYVATGVAETWLGGQYHWMVKVDSCGYEVPGYCADIGINENSVANEIAMVYPNPARDHAVVNLNKHFGKTKSVKVTAADGKVIFENLVKDELNQLVVPLQNVLAGTYFISLHDGSGKLLQTLSIIVE